MQPKWSTKPERFIWPFTEKVNQPIVTDPLAECVSVNSDTVPESLQREHSYADTSVAY